MAIKISFDERGNYFIRPRSLCGQGKFLKQSHLKLK